MLGVYKEDAVYVAIVEKLRNTGDMLNRTVLNTRWDCMAELKA